MIRTILNKFEIHSKEDFFAFVWQVIKFGIVGCSNTVIALAVYWLLCHLGMHYAIAFAVGEVVSILNAYVWSNLFVFKQKEGESRNHAKSVVKVFTIYISTFLLAEALLYLQVDYLGWNEKLAPVINLIFTIPINFLFNKFWAFKDRSSEAHEEWRQSPKH